MVVMEPAASASDKIGRRIAVDEEKATVLFEGPVGKTSGTWLGVEWDNPSRGKHDGTHEGVSYFQPRLNSGPTSCSFLRHNKVDWGQTMIAGVRERYGRVDGDTAGVDSETIDSLRRETGARFVQVVGFDQVNSKQSQLDKLRTISLTRRRINDEKVNLIDELPALRELDLSDNLLTSWERVSDLLSELPLEVLNVSENLLEVDRSLDFLTNRLTHLRQLVLGEMGYNWIQLQQVAGKLPCLEVLQAYTNKVDEIVVDPGMFPRLKELDLDNNLMSQWDSINQLDNIPHLAHLKINNNQFSSVKIEGERGSLLKNLKTLFMTNNKFESWSDIAHLNKLQVKDLRFRNCPAYNREQDEDRSRQIVVAMVASVEVMNGSRVLEKERRWAEIDYLKQNGAQWLEIQRLENTEEKQERFNAFLVAHPRFPEIIERLGEPEEGETKKIETSLKAILVPVTIRCPILPGSADTVKKLPLSMTVAKVKALLHRLYKKSMGSGAKMRLSLVSGSSPDHEQEMDNDLKELAYYSLEKGDIILIRW